MHIVSLVALKIDALKVAKYNGYLAFGHLISPIELHPDPNLILWDSNGLEILCIFTFARRDNQSPANY